MTKEDIRRWYKLGGRLQLPIDFVGKPEGGRYRVFAVEKGKITEDEYAVWNWLGRRINKLKVDVDVAIAKYRVSVSGDVGMVFWVDKPKEGAIFVFVVKGVDIVGGSVQCEDEEEVEYAKIMFRYLKDEIEERLNGLLEKVLYE
jgi:hypothetical protein